MSDDPRSSSGSHQILATSDVARLMAFACATFSDDDLPTVKIPPAAGAGDSSTVAPGRLDRPTGLHRRVAAWNGRTGEVGCCEHPVFGQIIAFRPDGAVADPFVACSGPRRRARVGCHKMSAQHLVLRFESDDDFWIDPERDVILIAPGSDEGGLLATKMELEFARLGRDQRLRYVLRYVSSDTSTAVADPLRKSSAA
ncbi:MAG: hypothetical protein AB7K09_20840 [Planctomycetota bacterium]